MSEESWDEQFKQFLRKTGDDFRRAGEEVRAEGQRLLDAAMDPQKQQMVRDRLNVLTVWARKSAEGVAGAMADAASQAQTAFHSATGKVSEATAKMTGGMSAAAPEAPSSAAPEAPKSAAPQPRKSAAPAKKNVRKA